MTDIRQGWTSASNAEFDLLCPGRHLAQRGLPDLPETEDAASGTRIHEFLAGKSIALETGEIELAEACMQRGAGIFLEWSASISQEFEKYFEKRLWIVFGNYKHSGQPDVVYVQGKRALCLDWKTGRNEVTEPNSNQQLRDLAVLVAFNAPEVVEVTVSIVQPFAKRQPPCVYDEKDLERAQKDLRHRVNQSHNPLAPRIAGEKQCRYCRAKGICKEYSEWTRSALPVIAASDLGIEKPWTPEQWAQFLAIAPEAESWIESKRQEAKALLRENPDAIPGYALKDGESREKITNAQAVFEQSVARGVTPESFMQAVTVTKKGLKAALRTTGIVGKELDSAIEQVCFGNTEKTPIDPKIVKV